VFYSYSDNIIELNNKIIEDIVVKVLAAGTDIIVTMVISVIQKDDLEPIFVNL